MSNGLSQSYSQHLFAFAFPSRPAPQVKTPIVPMGKKLGGDGGQQMLRMLTEAARKGGIVMDAELLLTLMPHKMVMDAEQVVRVVMRKLSLHHPTSPNAIS